MVSGRRLAHIVGMKGVPPITIPGEVFEPHVPTRPSWPKSSTQSERPARAIMQKLEVLQI
jgi:hypothetical protein